MIETVAEVLGTTAEEIVERRGGLPRMLVALLAATRRATVYCVEVLQLMNVTKGDRVGPYEIVSRLGAGGMGEVWAARDTRLDRSVAVKILPAELAQSASFRTRFEREAKTISQLNHPNICTLYDVGDEYLVMELLEGESLAARLEKGPLPIADVFRYGAQIAAALDKAHRAGIVHRDLKPANIMITKNGAKLLDFGLAKLAAAAVEVSDVTAHRPLTQEGMIVGTFQYMAPEQLEGAEADARTDIFAFGALLYEMATGTRAFQGSTRTSLIAAIVGSSPRPLAEIRPSSPLALDHIISRCLEKDPDERWQSVHDIRQELLWTAECAARPVTHARRVPRKAVVAALVAPWIILAAAAAWVLARPDPPMTVSSIVAPPGYSFEAEQGVALISPDGRRVAFVAASETTSSLFVRDLSEMKTRALAGTEHAAHPFWSPDSRSLGFVAEGKLKTISVDGGPAQVVADAPTNRGSAWGGDTIVFNAAFRGGLFTVPALGGTPQPLTQMAPGEISHRWPAFLPDGEHVIFLAQRAEGGSHGDPSTIEVVSLRDGKRTSLLRANSSAFYAPPGYLLFWREKSLMAQRFDARSLELSGPPMVVAEDVGYSGTEAAMASVSNSGVLVFQQAGESKHAIIAVADRKGVQSRIESVAVQSITGLSMSDDGTKLAYAVTDQGDDIRVVDLARDTTSRLTFHNADEASPVWSPDGTRIAFFTNRRDGGDLYVIAADGGETEQPLLLSPEASSPTDWSPDGRSLLLDVEDPNTQKDIWIYSFADRTAKPLIRTPFSETEAVFSPDGKWIAYTSNQSGRAEVYVHSRDGSGRRSQVSTHGGAQPEWKRDGKELYFVGLDRQLFAVAVKQGPQLEFSAPVGLFTYREGSRNFPMRTYAVSPDGQRFPILSASAASVTPVTLVQNWTELLRK